MRFSNALLYFSIISYIDAFPVHDKAFSNTPNTGIQDESLRRPMAKNQSSKSIRKTKDENKNPLKINKLPSSEDHVLQNALGSFLGNIFVWFPVCHRFIFLSSLSRQSTSGETSSCFYRSKTRSTIRFEPRR